MRGLVIGNSLDSDSGLLGLRLSQLGFSLETFGREHPRFWPSLSGVDVLILLGSDWSVYSAAHAREVGAEIDLLKTAARRGTPIFGICYGAQIICTALGGEVRRASRYEVGWNSVSSSEFANLLSHKWMQWHYDKCAPPKGLRVVASNDFGPQALLARRLFATQFHPEVTVAIVTRWCMSQGGAELKALGISPERLIDETMREFHQVEPRAARLIDWFVESVGFSDKEDSTLPQPSAF